MGISAGHKFTWEDKAVAVEVALGSDTWLYFKKLPRYLFY